MRPKGFLGNTFTEDDTVVHNMKLTNPATMLDTIRIVQGFPNIRAVYL